MNSDEALKVSDAMIATKKVTRFSKLKRVTKGFVFRTESGRHFAVKLNVGPAHTLTQRTTLMFERAPGGRELDWDSVSRMADVTTNDRQFESSLFGTKGANLAPGKQMSALVAVKRHCKR